MYRDRVIPPDEAQRIFARALELQRAQGGGKPLGEADIVRLADELGIEERFVKTALASGGEEPERAEKGSFWTGTPLKLAVERQLDDRIDRDDHGRIVAAIRRAAGDRGQTEIIGDEIAWSLQPMQGRGTALQVTVSPSPDGGTVVRAEEDIRRVVGGVMGGIMGGIGTNALLWSFLAPLAFHAPIIVSVGLIALIVVLFGVLRTALGAYARGRKKKLTEISDEIVAAVSRAASAKPERKVRVSATKEKGKRVAVEEEEDDAEAEQEAEVEKPRGTAR